MGDTLTRDPVGMMRCEGRDMAAKKRTLQVRVDEDVAKLAAKVAALEDTSAPDLLSEILRPLLKARYAKVMDKERRQLRGDEPAGE